MTVKLLLAASMAMCVGNAAEVVFVGRFAPVFFLIGIWHKKSAGSLPGIRRTVCRNRTTLGYEIVSRTRNKLITRLCP